MPKPPPLPPRDKITPRRVLIAGARYACLFLALCAVFFGLLLAAYAVPQEKVEPNARAGMELLANGSGGYWPTIPFGNGLVMDYRTDAWMLEFALRAEGDSLVESAQVPFYARYWHGYQVYLRPALALGNLQQLRWVNALVQYAALCLLAALVAKRLNVVIALCLGAALALVEYLAVPYSFQFSGVFLVMLGASVALLALYEKPWFRARIPYFFFIVGGVTVFIDLLTAPIVTLGVPLILLLLLRMKEREARNPDAPGLLRNFLSLIGSGAAWAAGYVALWFGKWAIASAVLGRNEIMISLRQILFRTGSSADGYINIFEGETADIATWDDFSNLNRFDALGYALNTFMDARRLPVFFACCLVLAFVPCFMSRRAREAVPMAAQLLAVALIAPIWLLALGQHTAIHSFFSYRNLMPTGLALLCLPAAMWQAGSEEIEGMWGRLKGKMGKAKAAR